MRNDLHQEQAFSHSKQERKESAADLVVELDGLAKVALLDPVQHPLVGRCLHVALGRDRRHDHCHLAWAFRAQHIRVIPATNSQSSEIEREHLFVSTRTMVRFSSLSQPSLDKKSFDGRGRIRFVHLYNISFDPVTLRFGIYLQFSPEMNPIIL